MGSSAEAVLRRNNVNVSGSGARTIIFAHGFGCDQSMWEPVARTFERGFRVVLFDYVGHGGSDLSAYDAGRYSSLAACADSWVMPTLGAPGEPDQQRRALYDRLFPIYRSVREAMPPVWAALAQAREAHP